MTPGQLGRAPRRLTWLLRAAAALLAGALLASCASASANYGPLASGGLGAGQECIPVPPGGVVSYGFQAFSNPGSAATVTKVDLAEPRNLRILQAWIVPVTGHDLYGVLDGYPPDGHLPRGVQWAQRQSADGAVIPHLQGPDVANLVLVLEPLAKVATAAGVNVSYTEAGTSYQLQTHFAIQVVTAKSCPSGPGG